VVEAIRKQAGKLLHGQVNIIVHEPILELIEELRSILPSSMDGFFFSNSGAEAVEGAIKLARQATGRPNIIVFQGSFHGRTVGTMSLTTSKTIYRSGYQPLMPGVFVAPYPYAYRYGWDEEHTSQWCLEELDYLLLTQTAPGETAAILVEPVLGEGGYVVPPASFLRGLRKVCDQHGILLIVDEIQSGFGRTGEWFALEHFSVEADILTVAKGLASGLPLSAVISPLDIMETGLRHLQEVYPGLGDVRGLGLMIGAEFRTPDHKPDKDVAKAVVHACLDDGLILITCGPWDNTVRWIPPLTVDETQIKQALDIFSNALDKMMN
jgi:4-aminobutyrate aminotransferase